MPTHYHYENICDRLVNGVEVPGSSSLDKEVTLSSIVSLEALNMVGFELLSLGRPSSSLGQPSSGRALVAFIFFYAVLC